MRRPAPLPAGGPGRTLAQRLTGRVDRIRQLNTRFGLRARRVYLVHTVWNGPQAGEGDESVISRVELLPTPRVGDASAINQRPWAGGTLPEGTIRVDQISARQCTQDVLTGLRLAHRDGHVFGCNCGSCTPDPRLPANVDFFYEIVEDGRGDELPYRERFRLYGQPWRNEGGFQFGVLLEAASQALDRLGESQAGKLDV